MSLLPESPSYPNYAGFLSNLIGGLPTDYRNAQLQQGAVDVQSAFKGGVPTNPDGTPNYAAALQMLARAGDPGAVAALGPAAQTQAWQTQAQTPSPMLGGGQPPAVPSQPPAAAPQAPAAPMPAPSVASPSPNDSASAPTLAALVASFDPDPAKAAMKAGLIARALKIDPNAPLTPEQTARAQRIIAANIPTPPALGQRPGGGAQGTAPLPQPGSQFGALSPIAPPQDQSAAFSDMRALEAGAGYDPNRNLTQAQATAIATGGNPASPASVGLPPAAEAVWQRMIPQESRGSQFRPDGTVVTSPKGAVGIAQVMPKTGPAAAKLAGLPWDPVRFKNDPAYNLALGHAYYAQQVNAFGSPDVAAAAYNAGPIAVLAAQAKATNRGGRWLDYLPAETQDYVAKVTAGGGALQTASGGPAAGDHPIVPQVPLPPGITDPQQAILALDREIARVSPNPYSQGQVKALSDYRDSIAASIAPMSVGPTTSIVDPRTGKPTFQGPFASGAGSLSPAAIDNAAEQYFQTGKLPPGMGRGMQGAATMNQVITRASELHPEADWSERPQAWQAFAGGAAGQSLLAKRTTSLALAENEAKSLIPRVRDASKNVSRTQYPSLNTIIEAGLTGTGDPNIVKFGIAVESLAQTYARVLSPSGAPTAADKANAHEILSKYWGQGQIDAALEQMELEIASAKQSLETTRRELGGGNRGGEQPAAPSPAQSAAAPSDSGQPVKVTTKEEYDALPKGTLYAAPDGSMRTKQ